MRLTHHLRALLLTIGITAALFITATPANAACEYHGSPQTGTVDCITWAGDEQPGGDEQPAGDEGDASTVSHNESGATSDEPVCLDSSDQVVPCTVQNEDGETCYFDTAVPASGDSAAGGVVYVCEPAGIADPAGATGAADPVVIAWRATASLGLRAIDMQIAPASVSDDAHSMGLVGLPVWIWSDNTPGTWGPQTASASDGPVNVTVTAQVQRIEWDMGDGTTVTCAEPGTPFDATLHSAIDESPDCGHTYLRTSDREPGGLYTVTATSYWTAEWADNTGRTGTIPFQLTTTEQIRIGELQVIRTGSS